MEVNKYIEKALETKLYHETQMTPLFSKISYLYMGLNGEVGELGEKLKKLIRDKECLVSDQDNQLLKKECADILWYYIAILSELGFSFDEIMEISLEKIQGRIERGTLQGSGDER